MALPKETFVMLPDAERSYETYAAGSPASPISRGYFVLLPSLTRRNLINATVPPSGIDAGTYYAAPSAYRDFYIYSAASSGGGGGSATAAPQFSIPAGSYSGDQSLTLTSATSGASIRYTTNGATPTSSSGTVYSGAITLSTGNTTVKAIAYKSGLTDSAVVSAAYVVSAPVAADPPQTNLVEWMDLSSAPTGTDGSDFTLWTDKTALGNNLTRTRDPYNPVVPLWDAVRGMPQFPLSIGASMDMPSAVTGNMQNFACYFLVDMVSTRRSLIADSFGDYHFLLRFASDRVLYVSKTGFLSVYDGGLRNSALRVPSSRCLLGMNSSGSGLQLVVNNNSDTISAFGDGTFNGGTIMGLSDLGQNWFAQCGMQGMAFYSAAQGGSDVTAVRAWAAGQGAVLDYDNIFILDGDSITQGKSSTLNRNWEKQATWPARTLRYNLAESSITLSTLLSEASTMVDPLIEPGKNNVCFIFAGTNDGGYDSAATVWSNTQSYISGRRTAGAARVVVMGMLPRSGLDAFRLSLRTLALTTFNVPSGVTGIWGDGSGNFYLDLGPDSAITLSGDGIHPDNAGYLRISTAWIAPLLPLIS